MSNIDLNNEIFDLERRNNEDLVEKRKK